MERNVDISSRRKAFTAEEVLTAILVAVTDNIPVIQKGFRDITGWVYEEKENGEKSQTCGEMMQEGIILWD